MTEEEVFVKNLILSTEFDRYILEHSDIAEKIPLNAQIVFLPETDPELSKINIEMAKKQHEKGQIVVYVRIGSIAPQLSRLTKVNLEVATAT